MEITHGRGPQPANETSDGGGTEGRERKTVSEYKYAVAIRKGTDLWLTLWVKRSKVGEFFVLLPRADGQWNPHGSYHLKGQFHQKSNDRKMDSAKQLQPLTGKFTGTEHLGIYGGHGTEIEVVCDPAHFNGVVEVPLGILEPFKGMILVDLVEPGYKPLSHPGEIVIEETFKDFLPHVVIRIART